jgi:uncharacterized damage-inducible protein DinB
VLPELRRLFDHARWADGLVLAALKTAPEAPAAAWTEFGHVLGAGEAWLSRLERRPPRVPVWPELPQSGVEGLAAEVHAGFASYLSRLTEARLGKTCAYTNTAGRAFENPIGQILMHAALHGQYHRGKVNLLLRQAGLAPAPCDYIAFVRGAAAATSGTARSS